MNRLFLLLDRAVFDGHRENRISEDRKFKRHRMRPFDNRRNSDWRPSQVCKQRV
jgi:hypothetical protein